MFRGSPSLPSPDAPLLRRRVRSHHARDPPCVILLAEWGRTYLTLIRVMTEMSTGLMLQS